MNFQMGDFLRPINPDGVGYFRCLKIVLCDWQIGTKHGQWNILKGLVKDL